MSHDDDLFCDDLPTGRSLKGEGSSSPAPPATLAGGWFPSFSRRATRSG